MEIYVVRPEDNLYQIAERYGISVDRLALDNGILYPYDLVVGQTIVIAIPTQSHLVQQGDTIESIALTYQVTPMQILRNNAFLADRKYLTPGEELVISYPTKGEVTVNGFAYPFINKEVLIKTLPSLTFLSIFNYTTTNQGDITAYGDDTEIIALSKAYGVVPLLILTTFTPQGISNIELAYHILLNEDYQERNINQFITIAKSKGYQGVNIVLNFLSQDNQLLYQNFLSRVSYRMQQEGLLFYITINYNIQVSDGVISFEQIDYQRLTKYVDGIIFLKFIWGTNEGPPAPVSNVNNIRTLLEYVLTNVPPSKIMIGIPYIGYDWKLPYLPNKTAAVSLSINSVMTLANDVDAVIQFDEASQTPFYYYNQFNFDYPFQHIVWFVDARSIDELNNLILEYDIRGSGVWNIMIYHQQLWTMINSTFDVIKLFLI